MRQEHLGNSLEIEAADVQIFSTRSAEEFALSVSKQTRIHTGNKTITCFACGEMRVSISRTPSSAIVIASTLHNEDWIELFLTLDALRSARNIVLVLTYCGYSRQDVITDNSSRGSTLLPALLSRFNISKVLLVDYHSQPLFSSPIQHISTAAAVAHDITTQHHLSDIVIVSPDKGGHQRALSLAERLEIDSICCTKIRSGEDVSVVAPNNLNHTSCVLVDDIIDTGSTIICAANALIQAGAKQVIAYATHGIFSHNAIELIDNSCISEVIVADTVALNEKLPPKFRRISIVSLIAEAIKCIM